jgi:5-methylthioadenosine/S-adenosylhomocysteine deaminase
MATISGARVLGLADRIGSITAGKDADIIIVDAKKPHMTPFINPFSRLVHAARGADVVTSIISGKIVMRNRRLIRIEPERVMEEVRKIAGRVAGAGLRLKNNHYQ